MSFADNCASNRRVQWNCLRIHQTCLYQSIKMFKTLPVKLVVLVKLQMELFEKSYFAQFCCILLLCDAIQIWSFWIGICDGDWTLCWGPFVSSGISYCLKSGWKYLQRYLFGNGHSKYPLSSAASWCWILSWASPRGVFANFPLYLASISMENYLNGIFHSEWLILGSFCSVGLGDIFGKPLQEAASFISHYCFFVDGFWRQNSGTKIKDYLRRTRGPWIKFFLKAAFF